MPFIAPRPVDPALLILLATLALIAARRLGGLRLAIWQAMALGAAAVLITGRITPAAALAAIDWEVLLFLWGMFVIGHALAASGALYAAAYRLLARVRSVDGLVLATLAAAGLASALLMNDTLAIVGTPLVLRLAREHRVRPALMLLALAFAITIGSVMSPIGNPQNLLIAVRGELATPFLTFLRALGPPTLLNLGLAYLVLRLLYRGEFQARALSHTPVAVTDPALARLAGLSVLVVVALILARLTALALGREPALGLGGIALAGALPILLFSRRRLSLLRHIDWPTLLFFVALFVLTAAVWQGGTLQGWLGRLQADPTAPVNIFAASLGLSQLISNVPLVALYLPLLGPEPPVESLMVLAAGSTIAGNLLIVGAASNVIIVQAAERRGQTLGFLEFARAGLPLGLANAAVYWAWFALGMA